MTELGLAQTADQPAATQGEQAGSTIGRYRLLERQEILGFTAITRADAQDAPVRGLMLIGIEGRGADRIMARLTAMAQVTAVHSTNGRWDLIVDLAAGSLSELDDVLRRIRDLDGVMTSETNLILSTRRAGTR